jgi:hypothetical protein
VVTVCAWCERFLGARDERLPVSHGICAPCADRQHWAVSPLIVVARHRADLFPVLEHLLRGDPPVILVVERRVGDRRRSGSELDPDGERRRRPDRRRRPADAILI